MKHHTFAFDFDGLIAQYDGFKGTDHIGEPIKEVVEAIKVLKNQGHKIIVYSTRDSKQLQQYCKKYQIPIDYFNENPEVKSGGNKPVPYAYVDDRTVLYKNQNAKQLVEELNNFKPYWN
ncbi:hypothetical protein HYZ64_03935 [Candidatus Berkelbacteria bacterium]|nr:hypothetical protein [Candidatus Berkelbacteria bacterium]